MHSGGSLIKSSPTINPFTRATSIATNKRMFTTEKMQLADSPKRYVPRHVQILFQDSQGKWRGYVGKNPVQVVEAPLIDRAALANTTNFSPPSSSSLYLSPSSVPLELTSFSIAYRKQKGKKKKEKRKERKNLGDRRNEAKSVLRESISDKSSRLASSYSFRSGINIDDNFNQI